MFQLHLTGSIEIIAELDFTYGFDLTVSLMRPLALLSHFENTTNEQNSTRSQTMLLFS
jgi:hypothetical protein